MRGKKSQYANVIVFKYAVLEHVFESVHSSVDGNLAKSMVFQQKTYLCGHGLTHKSCLSMADASHS